MTSITYEVWGVNGERVRVSTVVKRAEVEVEVHQQEGYVEEEYSSAKLSIDAARVLYVALGQTLSSLSKGGNYA